jgi:hypothetical protein
MDVKGRLDAYLEEGAREAALQPEIPLTVIRRARMRRRVVAIVTGLTIVALSIAGTAGVRALTTRGAARPVTGSLPAPRPSPSILYLDPPLNTEWLAPPGDAKPKLTAAEAIAAFEAVDTVFALPSDATYRLGFYSAGPRFDHRLAWGYSWYECEAPRHEVPAGTKLSCTAWLFLDANTGEMLESTWQQGT